MNIKNISKEEAGWLVARSWLTALEHTARDFHGRRPKSFCSRAYEHATAIWLRILENEYGIEIPRSDTIKEAIENYIALGVKMGIFKDASNFDLEEVNPNKLEIKVHLCPYRSSCKDLLKEGFSLKQLTCARLGCFAAAAKLLINIDCNYEVVSVGVEGACEGFVERV